MNYFFNNFRNLFNVIGNANIIVNSEGKIKHVNNACLNIFGYTEKDLLNKNLNMLIPNKINYFIKGNILVEGFHKNGKKLNLNIELKNIKMCYKNRILLIIDDKVYLTKMFYNLDDNMSCVATVDGHFKDVNKKFVDILGYSKEELCKTTFLNFVYEDDIESTIFQLKKLSNGEKVINFKNRYYTKDKRIVWLSWIAKQPDANNLVYAIAKDITVIENKLSRYIDLEIINEDIEYLANIGTWKWFIYKDVLEWSDGLKKIFKIKDVSFDNYMKSVHEDDRDKINKNIEICIKNKSIYEITHRIIVYNNNLPETRYIYGRGKYQEDRRGDYMIGIAQSISKVQYEIRLLD